MKVYHVTVWTGKTWLGFNFDSTSLESAVQKFQPIADRKGWEIVGVYLY